MKTALLFPGQGSQTVGMGKDFYTHASQARNVFQEVDDILNQNLSKIIFEGPQEQLNLTENTQPALMCVSVAIYRTLIAQCDMAEITAVAGHSLGEYTALTIAKSLPLAQTAQLLKARGQAMQAAVPVGEGAMAAVIGLDVASIKHVLSHLNLKNRVVMVANENCPGQSVISGHAEAVHLAKSPLLEAGAKRLIFLPVSAPFHCTLMASAEEKMRDILDSSTFNTPQYPIVTNVDAALATDPTILKDKLVKQVSAPVLWHASMQTMLNLGVNTFIEIGAGAVLSHLMKRIQSTTTRHTLNTMDVLDNFINTRGRSRRL